MLQTAADTITDSFNYTVTDSLGVADIGVVTITIHGANDNPVAVDDTASATETGGANNTTPGFNPSGNVLSNDTDRDSNGETKTVVSFRTGASEGLGTIGVFGIPLAGTRGSLTMAADGSYTYTVNNNDPVVDSLQAGQSLTDSFNYTMTDAVGRDRHGGANRHDQRRPTTTRCSRRFPPCRCRKTRPSWRR